MRKLQCSLFMLKRSNICYYVIYTAVCLKLKCKANTNKKIFSKNFPSNDSETTITMNRQAERQYFRQI